MKTRISLLIALCAFLGFAVWWPTGSVPQHHVPVVSASKPSPAVLVINEAEETKCSGFVIRGTDNRPYLWTAAHCTDGARSVLVVNSLRIGKRELTYKFRADVLAEFDKIDVDAAVAVINAPVEVFDTVQLAEKGADVADEIYHIGWFLGKYRSYAIGHVSWVGDTVDATDLLAQPGSSGGPVFNMQGEVVGIIVGMRGSFLSNKQQLYTPVRAIRYAAFRSGLDYAL